MRIGILSDTHDDIENLRKAISIFNNSSVDYVFHAGDYIFPGMIDELKGLKSNANFKQLVGVYGNNDGERFLLLKKFFELKGELKGEYGEKEIDGNRIGIYHGTNEQFRNELISEGNYDVFIYGHTHIKEYRKIGKTLILNPGTLHKNFPNIKGEVEKRCTIIIYNTEDKTCQFIDIDTQENVDVELSP